MVIKTQELLMLDHHGTFIFSTGGIITEKQWSFSAININKAILKLKITNTPSSIFGSAGLAIDYYDLSSLEWKELGSVEKWWGGDAYKEIDVTSTCRANPQFKWRARVWVPYVIYYSCMDCKAYLYLEYTLISGEPEATGVQTTSIFGNEALAPVAEGFSLMINVMFMMMFMSLIMSMIDSIIGG